MVPVLSAKLLEILLGKSCLPLLVAPTDSKFKYTMILRKLCRAPNQGILSSKACHVMLLRSFFDVHANIVHQRLFLPSGAWMHAHRIGVKKGSGATKHSKQEVFIHNSCEGRPLALYVLAYFLAWTKPHKRQLTWPISSNQGTSNQCLGPSESL